MSAPSNATPIPDTAREAAAAWHVRLNAETADETDWLEFEAWLGAGPDHQRAYAAVEQAWVELDEAPASARGNLAVLAPRPSRRTAMWGGAIAAGLAAVTVTGAMFWTDSPTTQTFDTRPGEMRTVTLADGTHITLNGGSHLTATLARRERRVTMADAEAVFDVAHDPARPFFVDAGEREIRVVGTEFNVLSHKGAVSVVVRRGIVEVRPSAERSAPPIARLTKGQSLTHAAGAHADTIGAADADAALSWTTGQLVFQNQPLPAVAETLSRYGTRRIEVSPDARELRVTATLRIGPQDAMLGALANFLPVRVEQQTDKVRLSLRR